MMNYRISKYTRILQVNDDVWFVYNLVSGAECLLDSTEVEKLKKTGMGSVNNDPCFEQWQDLGIVVDTRVDEDACLELERKIAAFSLIKEQFGIVIAPTMDCNAGCFYCYENKTRSEQYMTGETRAQLIRYIKKMGEGKKKIFISWFGGEPLLCYDQLEEISNEIIRFCDAEGIIYESEMTTNGYYLSQFYSKLKDLRISEVQITLDGYGQEHEKRKNYHDCTDSWDRTIQSIFLCSVNGIHVTLRMNVDRSNIDGIKKTTEMLLSDSRWNDNISIYYYPLEPVDCCSPVYFEEEEYASVMKDVYGLLFKLGYYNKRQDALGFQKLQLPCYGATLAVTAVDYKGLIYQCQHLLCREDKKIGDIWSGILISQDVADWYNGILSEQCKGCEVLPLCQGGCVTKRNLGQKQYLCHMSKYRLAVQEQLKVILLKEQYGL